MKTILTFCFGIVIFFLLGYELKAQPYFMPKTCDWLFQRFTGDETKGVMNVTSATTDDVGNLYFTGQFSGRMQLMDITLTSQGGFDVYAAAIYPSGNLMWAISLGSKADDYGGDIAILPDNKLAFAVNYGSPIQQATTKPQLKALSYHANQSAPNPTQSLPLNAGLVVINAQDGTPLKSARFGSMAYLTAFLYDDDTKTFYVGGSFEDTLKFGNQVIYESKGRKDVFLAKYDPIQEKITPILTFGATGNEELSAIARHKRTLYLCGGAQGAIIAGSKTFNTPQMRRSAYLAAVQDQKISDIYFVPVLESYATALAVNPKTGTVYMSGIYTEPTPTYPGRAFIATYSTPAQPPQMTIVGGMENQDLINDIALDTQGRLVFVGTQASTIGKYGSFEINKLGNVDGIMGVINKTGRIILTKGLGEEKEFNTLQSVVVTPKGQFWVFAELQHNTDLPKQLTKNYITTQKIWFGLFQYDNCP